ncbi:hypothetical protein GCM10010411_20490 [Actinomadura fulvescens]|uniref:PPE family domain-containing protein n=1 Tax=Actinomadura fulvescens TaxID=46160 RepID=A0ABP6BXB9_9ACTN
MTETPAGPPKKIQDTRGRPEEWHGGFPQMQDIMRACDPGRVRDTGEAYLQAAQRLEQTADLIRRHAVLLAQAWKGEDSIAAQRQLKRLFQTSNNWSAGSQKVGQALQAYSEKLTWYKANPPADDNRIINGTVKFDGWTREHFHKVFGSAALGDEAFKEAQKEAADRHINYLGSAAVDINATLMPKEVVHDLPAPGSGQNPPPQSGIPSGGSGGTPTGGKVPGAGSGGFPGVGTGSVPVSAPSASPFGGGTGSGGGADLAGLGQPGPGGGAPGGSDPFGRGNPAPGVGGGPGGGGAAAGAPPGGLGGGAVPSAGSGRGTGAGAGAARPGAGPASGRQGGGPATSGGRTSRSGMMGGAPLGGPAGNKEEHEAERTTWLSEDPEVWTGAEDDEAAPPVIT